MANNNNVAVTTSETAIAAPSSAATPPKEKMVKIKLELTREHKDDIFVSVNDKKYQIKRGVEVEVPWFVAEILKNQEKALMTLFENQTKAQERVL